jgi:glycosyltransferase involved in cell wall biosynthesis/SAM-dependent methyltransferase
MNLNKYVTQNQDNIDELERYKKECKDSIELLVEEGHIEEAKYMISEYEKIISGDVDLYSIKGIISILEENLEMAEKILEEGLDIKPFNFDILYNLAYLYMKKETYITAYRFYKKALKVAKYDMVNIVEDSIKELEEIKEVKEYKKRKKVLFIAYIFPPVGGSGVQRSLKFVKYLRDFGWEPVVVTVGNTKYPLRDEFLVSEIPEQIEIIRIDEKTAVNLDYANKLIQIYRETINDDNILNEYVDLLNKSPNEIERLLFIPDSYILWASEVIDKLDDKCDLNEIDLIYTTSGPYSDHIIGNILKKKYNKPWVADFRDEWTNNPYNNSNKEDLMYRINYAMEKNIVELADQIITVTPASTDNYKQIFNIKEEKINTITNGYDEIDFLNIQNNNKNNKFTIIHNGLLYSIRTPLTVMKSIKNLIESGKIDKSKIQMIFGFTENLENWIKYRDDLGLKDIIKFLDYMPHDKSLEECSNSDALLLIVGPGEKNKSVYPGKIFEYLRLCKPIIALSPKDSIIEKLLDETNRGKNVDFNDINGIEECILNMYNNWQEETKYKLHITADINKYERKKLTQRLSEIFFYVLKNNEQSIDNSILKEKNYSFYDNLFESGGWDNTYFKHYSETHYYECWLKALELIKKINNCKMIEIGCGPGQFANLLFENGIKNYKGIDFSEQAIKYAKLRNENNKDLFKVDNAYTSDIFNEDYNTVVIFEMMEHIDEDLKVLSRIKKNSNILFSVPNFYSDGHVRWFNSRLEVIERYRKYVEFEDILSFDIGGVNKIFLVKGKINDNI